MRLRTAALVFGLAFLAAPLAAQPTIFVVRHAERGDAGTTPAMNADPDLSETGRTRAESLATLLKDVPLTAIYATEFKRTQQTAAPTARMQKLEPVLIPQKDLAALVDKLKAATGNVLVVGHSNTVGEIARALGVSEPITIADTDFDNLLIVVPGPTPRYVRLHYR
jgi:broad specificity phosphatase PhoE